MTGTAGVIMEGWKLAIFKKRLDAAGYKYEEAVPFGPGVLLLKVHYEWLHKLQPIIEAAHRECAEAGKP